MSDAADRLPYVDEHEATVEGSPEATWEALLHVVDRSFASAPAARGARLLGCSDVARTGPRPLSAGSTLPGFHIAVAEPPRELALRGHHRFSDYALIFRLDAVDARVRLRAETRAEFPGLHGSAYRALVIGTRGHVVVVRRLLTAVKRRTEREGGGG